DPNAKLIRELKEEVTRLRDLLFSQGLHDLLQHTEVANSGAASVEGGSPTPLLSLSANGLPARRSHAPSGNREDHCRVKRNLGREAEEDRINSTGEV
ncbi:hypothetical protein CRUP_009392, partial [Coryphaenoides rupestris]